MLSTFSSDTIALANEAQQLADLSNKVYYVVQNKTGGYEISTLTPHCREWKASRFLWVQTVRPISKKRQ